METMQKGPNFGLLRQNLILFNLRDHVSIYYYYKLRFLNRAFQTAL